MTDPLKKINSFYRFSPYHYPKWHHAPGLSSRIDRVLPSFVVPALIKSLGYLLFTLSWLFAFYLWIRLLDGGHVEAGEHVLTAITSWLVILLSLLFYLRRSKQLHQSTSTIALMERQEMLLSREIPRQFDKNFSVLVDIYQGCRQVNLEDSYFCIIAGLGLAERQLQRPPESIDALDRRWAVLYQEMAMASVTSSADAAEQICMVDCITRPSPEFTSASFGEELQRIWFYLYPYVYVQRELATLSTTGSNEWLDETTSQGSVPMHRLHSGELNLHHVPFENLEFVLFKRYFGSSLSRLTLGRGQFEAYQQQVLYEVQQITRVAERPIVAYVLANQHWLLDTHPVLQHWLSKRQS